MDIRQQQWTGVNISNTVDGIPDELFTSHYERKDKQNGNGSLMV